MSSLAYLLTGSMDNTARKCNLVTQKQFASYCGHDGGVICIKVSEDNRLS